MWHASQEQGKFDGKEFKGIKVRFTHCPLVSGHMSSVFLQIPGLKDEEIPQEIFPSGVGITR